MEADDGGTEVRVGSARKRDAGRGIARLPTHVQSELGVLSGDPVVIEGDRLTVAKVWPGDGEDRVVRIDGDTRASAGVNVGETVTIRTATVQQADEVTLQPASDETSEAPTERTVHQNLVDRLVRTGKQLRVDGFGPYVVTATRPGGSVRVTDATAVTVDPETATIAESSPESSADESDERIPDTTYEDIGGLDEELDLVREMVELPLSEPKLFAQLGIAPPKGVLLYGPPGTGKTLIARAVANEVDAHFETIHGPEIVSKYKGESEQRLRDAFDRAAANAPAIVFVDEIDSIASTRDDDGDMENRVVAQLLTLLDGLDSDEQVIVIGATNRVDDIDPAIRRGGRFDREIEIGVPGERGRREILDVHTRDMPLADDVDRDELAARLHGFVGADIASLAREAGMAALRRQAASTGLDVAEITDVSYVDDDVTVLDESATGAHPPGETGTNDSSLHDERPSESGAGSAERGGPSTGAGVHLSERASDLRGADLEVAYEDFEEALTGVEPSGMREYVAEQPDTTFDDVGGLRETKERLREAIEWPLSYAPLFEAAATDPPTGVLLYGPPGTGKTLLAEAIAGESGVNFVRVAGPEILDRYVGESEQAIRELFERARQTAPAIVFLDEIDAIATARGEGHEVTERVVSQLLTELDRAGDHPKLVVIAATNRKDTIDPALLRPGRFEQHIEVPRPDEAARQEILQVHTRGRPIHDEVDLDDLAASTRGYSGAELEALVREAAMRAIRDVARTTDPDAAAEYADEVVLTAAHFETAREAVDARSKA